MLANHLNKIVTALLVIAVRLGNVSYASHPAARDQAVSAPSQSHTYLPLPPGR